MAAAPARRARRSRPPQAEASDKRRAGTTASRAWDRAVIPPDPYRLIGFGAQPQLKTSLSLARICKRRTRLVEADRARFTETDHRRPSSMLRCCPRFAPA